ncbi:hypothetical protein AXF42_Ash021116 [Apostasia shenzhenica]|uniref:DUF547 domain-containing protein n=1 Tax=Apostasia shenzhenica TaxID=1088818 RepID=A0A2H9ZWY2_9ASPA|nr:hypothetical protein AXF42_Ash021116 [Apostasia shenzhenica]
MAANIEMKSESRERRRKELEEEVAMFQRLLGDEERVHEILQRALLPKGIPSVLHIPNFLPKKVKELLAELIMVEEEISQLETEISKIQQSISYSQESRTQDSKMFDLYKHKSTSLSASSNQASMSPTRTPRSKVFDERVVLETKPMFFINQAMKGDYSNLGFAGNGTILETVSRKEMHRMASNQDMVPRKSGVIEQQPLPKLPPRHPSHRQPGSYMEVLHKLLSETTWNTSPLQKNGQTCQPNKLSEKTLKCLICIFLRLMRTSRTMEPEKPSNISRSNNSFSRTQSFRLENSLNLSSSLNTNRDSGQKDPYGIFEMEGSLSRDIGPYKNLVRFTSRSLEMKGISSCLPLLKNLRILMSNLQEVNLKSLTHQQKLAFWINIHNACVMHAFLEHGLPSNPEKILALRNKAVLNIGGHKINAFEIEHFILKHRSNTNEDYSKSDNDDIKEAAVRSIHGLEQAEPNVVFALCCGSRSSPAVKLYTSEGVSAELEKSKLEYLQASIVVAASRRVMIPNLLASNMSNFAMDVDSLVEWICIQLPTSGSLRKSIGECVRFQSNGKISDIVDILPYDLEFQYLLPM